MGTHGNELIQGPLSGFAPSTDSRRPRTEVGRYRRKVFLIGAAVQAELQGFVRGNCIAEEVARMDDIIEKWRTARDVFGRLEAREKGLPEQVRVHEPENSVQPLLARITEDPLFRSSFGLHTVDVKKVELDRLVACQRQVDLDYVDSLKEEISNDLSSEEHARFCLLPRTPPPAPKQQQLAQNAFGFSSPNPDFRFLGGFARPVTIEDIQVCWAGGQPVSAVVLLLGYGAPSMNVFQVGKRLILNNGFHRAYAMRAVGISEAYVVVQHIGDPELELPPALVGLPREYLLKNSRPALMSDFFNSALVEEFKTTEGVRSVQLGWNANQTFVPV
jgi:hypothetical protein